MNEDKVYQDELSLKKDLLSIHISDSFALTQDFKMAQFSDAEKNLITEVRGPIRLGLDIYPDPDVGMQVAMMHQSVVNDRAVLGFNTEGNPTMDRFTGWQQPDQRDDSDGDFKEAIRKMNEENKK